MHKILQSVSSGQLIHYSTHILSVSCIISFFFFFFCLLSLSPQSTNCCFFHFKRENTLLVSFFPDDSTFDSICLKKNSLKKLYIFFPPNCFLSFSLKNMEAFICLHHDTATPFGLSQQWPPCCYASDYLLALTLLVPSLVLETLVYSCCLIASFSLGFHFLIFLVHISRSLCSLFGPSSSL